MSAYDVNRRKYPKTNISHWLIFSGDRDFLVNPEVHQFKTLVPHVSVGPVIMGSVLCLWETCTGQGVYFHAT